MFFKFHIILCSVLKIIEFVRKIEQGKDNHSFTKVNRILMLFGHVLGPVNAKDYETPTATRAISMTLIRLDNT
ncbi:hypothetical protein D3C86_2018530 [compost metagenome]